MREYGEVSDRPPQRRVAMPMAGRRAHSQNYGWQPLLRFDREPNKQRLDEYDAADTATPVAGRWGGV
jgi:hypothetical protein